LVSTEDRYGGVEVTVADGSPQIGRFDCELKESLRRWQSGGKRGVWLKLPLRAAAYVGPGVANGFSFHHAKDDYVLLTRWLPADSPNTLPKYSFTQIGVGGVVVNGKDEVLMVVEKVSPLPMFQGSWKLPGGLADPGEDFADTVAREVREETGVVCTLIGVASLRHTHSLRFGQGDLYVVVKLRAEDGKDKIELDRTELQDAQWMPREKIKELAVKSGEPLNGKVSENNLKMIENALNGTLIEAAALPNSRGGKPTLLYTAAQTSAPASL